ncbi:MAG: hypothetical protein H7A46_09310 [Verrucomicrobiales bacterium]|nr:hypothetical protein [Verrucomicrobiales bacterium]
MRPLRRNLLGLWLVVVLALGSLGILQLLNVTRGEYLHAATERYILRHVGTGDDVAFQPRENPVNGWKNLGHGRWQVWGAVQVANQSWPWAAEVEPPERRDGQPRVCILQVGDVLICSNFVRIASSPFKLGSFPP